MISTINDRGSQQTSAISPVVASVLLVLAIAGGAVCRLHLLTSRSLWVDEAASVMIAQLPWRDFWTALWKYEANMSLYYLLLRGWMHLLGDSETAVRGLSVLFGVAAIPAAYLVGERLFGRKAALAGAALLAVNLFVIRYSQEARGYSLVMLLVIFSTYFFVRAVDSPGQKKEWTVYVFISALAVYSHMFACLVILAQWLSLGYARLQLIGRRTVLWTGAGFISLTMPMAVFVLLKEQGQLNWVPRPTAQLLLNFGYFITGNGGVRLLAAYAALCLVAVFWPTVSERRRSPNFDERWRLRLVVWWLIFPIASTLLVSIRKPVFYDRFMIISVPALVLLAGYGMVKVDEAFIGFRGLLFPALLSVTVGWSLLSFHRYNDSSSSQGDDWRSATRYILAQQQSGDAAFFYRASGSRPFTYYVRREMQDHGSTQSPSVVFPLDVNTPQGFNLEPNEGQAILAIGEHRRIWLILQHYEGSGVREAAVEAIRAALQKDYSVSKEQVFPGTSGTIRVILYLRRLRLCPA